MIGKLEVGVIAFLVLAVSGIFAFGQLTDIQGSQTTRISGQRILIDDPNAFLNITDGSNWSKLSGSGGIQLCNRSALPICDANTYGSQYYNGSFYKCNKSGWSQIGAGGAGGVSAFKDLTFDNTPVDMQGQELDNLSKVGSIESESSQYNATGNHTYTAYNTTHSKECYWYFDTSGNYTLTCQSI